MQHPLSRLKPYLSRYKKFYIIGIICIVFNNFFLMFQPWFVKNAIDSLEKTISQSQLIRYGLLIVLFTCLSGLFRFMMRWFMITTSRRVQFDLRNNIFRHLLRLTPSFYHEHRTGDLISRASNDLEQVRAVIGPGIMYLVNTSLTFAFCLTMMTAIDVRLTLVALIPYPLIMVLLKYVGDEMRSRSQAVQEYTGVLSSKIQDNLTGIRVVKSYGMEGREIANFKGLNQHYVHLNMRAVRITAIFLPIVSSVTGIGLAMVLWYGGRQVILQSITLGDFVGFMVYLMMLTWPTISVGWILNMYQSGVAAMKRINEIFTIEPDIVDGPKALPQPLKGRVQFQNVTFSYNGDNPILDNLNFTLEPGKTLAIIGPTGCGKSTVVNLLCRFYDPQEGRILIDGQDIREISLNQLRQVIGVVPQEAFLFSDTLENNIALGISEWEKVDIYQALQTAKMEKDLEQLPKDIKTILGERGVNLSGGQKQRTAIARAILKSPRILVFDDAFSNVDNETENEILHELDEVISRRSVILIAHRISTVKDADRILVMVDGKLVEQGDHASLMEQDGYYAQLYHLQLIEDELVQLE